MSDTNQEVQPVSKRQIPHFLRILPKSRWNIDFARLNYDFSNFALIWKESSWEDIALAFFGLCGSIYDIFSDALLSQSYLTGADYIKTVRSQNDSAVKNCTLIGQGTYVDLIENKTENSFKFSCFEKDIYWGWMTSSFIFLPGLLASPLILHMIYNVGHKFQ